ncbi:MAG: flagellar hook-basal body complex protein FliE [Candidatus Latescibacteria bacterium 4484_7]|nr:MAG: flagellar hook-basal body complex protein FliE [Candidatus Latescibacteria bacterium 4484_7]RKZ06444.1 MAG: flagellar hook-basal body complex protein FliE [bacterium]
MKIRPSDISFAHKSYLEQKKPPKTGFGEMLKKMVSDVDNLSKTSQVMTQSAINGAPVEAHDVMISVEETRLAFDLMLEVRNKLIEAYRELMQMRM